MFKPTPNPPFSDSASAAEKTGESETDPPARQLFSVVNGVDSECLLANLSETLASANALVSYLAFDLEDSRRHVALGIQQLIELGELLTDRALDNLAPH